MSAFRSLKSTTGSPLLAPRLHRNEHITFKNAVASEGRRQPNVKRRSARFAPVSQAVSQDGLFDAEARLNTQVKFSIIVTSSRSET